MRTEKRDALCDSCPRPESGLLAGKYRNALSVALMALPTGCATLNQEAQPAQTPITTVYIPAVPSQTVTPQESLSDSSEPEIESSPACVPASQVSYLKVWDFHEGLAVAQDKSGYLFIGKDGRPVGDERFDYAESFSNGRAAVNKHGELFYVNHQLQRVDRPEDETVGSGTNRQRLNEIFDHVGAYSDGMASAIKGSDYYYIDENGQIAFKEDPKWSYTEYREGYMAVRGKNTGRAAHVDKYGQFIYPNTFDSVRNFSEGMAAVREKQDWYHVYPNGHAAYRQRFDYVGDFSGGVAVARKGKRWFHIQPDGRPAYEKTYDGASDYSEGMASVQVGNRSFHIGMAGSPYPDRESCKR